MTRCCSVLSMLKTGILIQLKKPTKKVILLYQSKIKIHIYIYIYIYIICPKNFIFRNFSLDIFPFVLIERCVCVCVCVCVYIHTHTYMDEIRIFIAVLFVIAKAGNILLCLLAQSCLTLCDPKECSPPGSSIHGDSPGKNTGVGCHALFQGIFPTQGWNSGLLHCRWIHYHLSHQGSLEMS